MGVSMSFKAIGDKVIVRKLDQEDNVTKGGLHIVESHENSLDKAEKATVVSVGSGKKEDGSIDPIPLKEGDVILYHKHYGTDLSGVIATEHDRGLMMLNTQDILGVFQSG
jgi:chaperonin GroES